jgi:hypothetical protein
MTAFKIITVGLSRYDHEPHWALEAADRCRAEVEDLFVHHGAVAEDWTPVATLTDLPRRFSKWAHFMEDHASAPSEPHDRTASSIIYWVGHGEDTGNPDNQYRLALRDSTSPLRTGTCFQGSDLFEYLLEQQRRRSEDPDAWVLVILDTCGSGSGAYRIHSSFSPPELPQNIGIIATTNDGAAFAGTFTTRLRESLEFTGNDTDGLPLRELMRRLEDRLGPNKVHNAFPARLGIPVVTTDLGPITGAVDILTELRQIRKDRPSVVVNHYYAKAQGAEVGELAWHFKGRVAERLKINRWLENSTGGMLVVTGQAGAGKSALLGMVLASTDDELMNALEALDYDVGDPNLRPGGVLFDAVLHLAGFDIVDFLADLSSALGVSATSPDVLLAEIADVMVRKERLTILLDALDESRDPFTIAAGVLRPLADLPRVRLVVGTRRSLGEDPDHPETTARNLINVLRPKSDEIIAIYRDPNAVRAYADERLRAAVPQAGRDQISRTAEQIARYDQPFLFARLAVHEIVRESNWLYPHADLEQLIGSGHSGVFSNAIRRYREGFPNIEALLHVLAYAHGNGFPRTDGIWAEAASVLTPEVVMDDDVAKAIREAAPYILEDSENGQAVYRLSHRTFAERYRADDQAL